MFTALAVPALALHPWHGGGFWFFLIPLFWIALIVALVAIFGRRRRKMWAAYGGPAGWHHAHATRSAESVLAERFANGDIDEKEYRARLEVLRATPPTPPVG